jgi:MEMO1 family protein
VFSSDLSHYLPYETAKRTDAQTVDAMLHETPQAIYRLNNARQFEACGVGPIMTALLLGDELGFLERRLLLYANSGDTSGNKEKVVGYAAIGLYEREASEELGVVSKEAGDALVKAARATITAHLTHGDIKAPDLKSIPELSQNRGLFVTLTKKGALRGCIGYIESDKPLYEIVGPIALDAALSDHRFAPVSAAELSDIKVEVSILSQPRQVSGPAEIIAGRDGVIVELGARRGLFLPQVWEYGMTKVEFLEEISSQKAGLPRDAYKSAELLTFQDQIFEEE